jgi:phosphoenolpyruvate-protein kinase (PTS system EI component)
MKEENMENTLILNQFYIMNSGIAFGQISLLNIKQILSRYTTSDFQHLFIYFNQLIDEFHYTYVHEHVGNFKKRDKLPKHIEYILRVIDRESFKRLFQKKIQEYRDPEIAIKKTFEMIQNLEPSLFESLSATNSTNKNIAFKSHIKRMTIKLKQFIYHQKIENLQTDSILCLCDFNVQYLYKLTKKVKAIIIKNLPKHGPYCKEICRAFDIPILYSTEPLTDGEIVYVNTESPMVIHKIEEENQQIYQNIYVKDRSLDYDISNRKIKFYAPMINDLNIDFVLKGPFYSGIAPFRTEYLYITKGAVPNHNELVRFFENIINQVNDKEIFIRLPDFRPDRPTQFLNDEFVDVNSYSHYPDLYYDFISAVAKTFKEHLVHLVLPMIRMRNEIFAWRSFIESIFENEDVILPQIGIMFETESQFEFYEEYDDIDFAIIGLNDFIEEFDQYSSRSDEMDKTTFFKKFSNELRVVHRFFRLKNIRHLIAGHVLSQPEILDRFLKMGFREICLPIKHIESLEPVIKAFITAKDQFIGLNEQRKLNRLKSEKNKKTKKTKKTASKKTNLKPSKIEKRGKIN